MTIYKIVIRGKRRQVKKKVYTEKKYFLKYLPRYIQQIVYFNGSESRYNNMIDKPYTLLVYKNEGNGWDLIEEYPNEN